MQGDLGPEIGLLELRYGDRLLLCSDGLTNEVSDREIGEILWSEPDIQRACKRLVHSANQAGGKDNITVLIIQYGDPGSQSHREKRKVLVRRTIGRSLRRKEADAEGI